MLKEKLMEELKEAMKNKDTIKKNTVQMVRAAILQIEKDKGIEVGDDKILEIIAKEVKTKKDALVDFEKAQRQDLIDQTNQEIAILQEYLPKQLSREEVKAEVEKIISEIGAISMKDMGAIMKEAKAKLENEFGVKAGDSIFFVADEFYKAQKIAGLVRIELGKRLDLIEKNVYKFCFIVDFPMYELSDEGTIDFCHNPFSMPQGGLDALENKDPLEILAYQYDLVCNGYEMASGAVRNHDPEIMVKAFEIAGYTEEDVKNRFGALYNAFQYGTPPHAGAAPGVDRMVMLIADSTNIREVIAFPKNKRARDLLMRAPSIVSKQQLDDVHIQLKN